MSSEAVGRPVVRARAALFRRRSPSTMIHLRRRRAPEHYYYYKQRESKTRYIVQNKFQVHNAVNKVTKSLTKKQDRENCLYLNSQSVFPWRYACRLENSGISTNWWSITSCFFSSKPKHIALLNLRHWQCHDQATIVIRKFNLIDSVINQLLDKNNDNNETVCTFIQHKLLISKTVTKLLLTMSQREKKTIFIRQEIEELRHCEKR